MVSDVQARAELVLAGGPGTFSKSAARYPQGIGPTSLVSGEGCYVIGDEGRQYLDTVSALGPIILGYGHPAVTEAVMQQVQHGTSFSMLHALEVTAAETLCRLLPCADMVRWCRNGTDSTNMAVRLMRAITGKRHIIFVGYAGGGGDSYGITTDKHAGILATIAPYNHQLTWGDWNTLAATLRLIKDDLAGILVEVPPLPWGSPPGIIRTALNDYQGLAHGKGALFTLDEVVTFPRYDLHGAQGLYGVAPDLCCVSKGIANGFPLAALVGQRRYMERLNVGDIFASWTFAGETTALAACQATLTVLETTDALVNLHTQGQRYGEGLVEILARYRLPATVWGHPSRLAVRWQAMGSTTSGAVLRTWWLAEHARRGVLLGIGVIFPMVAWQDTDVTHLLAVADEVGTIMRMAIDEERLVSDCPCPVIADVLAVRS